MRVVLRLAASSIVLTASVGAAAENPMRITVDKNTVTIWSGERAVLGYRYRDYPRKPYVQQFFSPGGVNVLRDNVADHVHHHGLMFALAADGVDFWSETEACGYQARNALEHPQVDQSDGMPRASFSESIEWVRRDLSFVLKEWRTIEVVQVNNGPVSLLTWQSRLELPQDKPSVMLTGEHYFGLGMRFLQCMDGIGQFSNASGHPGEVVRGDERNVPAAWCAYTAEVESKPVTTAMFGYPDNVRNPTTWFTMAQPFAYMSATLNLHKEPLTLEPGKPLVLRYAVALWDGRIDAARIDELYRRWITWPAPGTVNANQK
jgi:hypothetical protein